METFQVRILEKFGVSSVVMPYFGYAHQSFLLLSRLSRGSRAMIDDFYHEMINWLLEWNTLIDVIDDNIKMLFLPSDLFKFWIDLYDEKTINKFIEFITMKHQHKGHYFNQHYMHERLWISNLSILPVLIQKLIPYFDILKSVKAINECEWTIADSDFNSCSIIDKFVIHNCDDFIVDKSHFILPQYLIDASKLVESENCWKLFYKIDFLYLTYESFSNTKSILEDIGNIGMQINYLDFSVRSIEELDWLTKPEYFSKGLLRLEICFNDTIPLSDIFFDNINQIKFKEISFKFAYRVTGSFDIIRILKNAPQNIKLNLNYGYTTNKCTLSFKNVPIKIVQSNLEDPLFVECKNFTCYVEINKLFESFRFNSIDSETNQSSRETFIHVKMPNKYKFNCYKLLNESEVFKTYKTKFPDHNSMSECEFIIPMKYLYSAHYGRKSIHSLISHKDRLEFMNEISRVQKISCSISYYSELKYLSEWASLFPQKCTYSIVDYSKPNNWGKFDSYIKSILDADNLDDFSHIKLDTISMLYGLSESSYEFIRRLLLLPNVQVYLNNIRLVFPKLSQTLSILSQLSDCPLIESVKLSYWANDSGVDSADLIKSSMNSFTKKVGIIKKAKDLFGITYILIYF